MRPLEDHLGHPDHVLEWHEASVGVVAVVAGVGRVGAVVPHDPHIALGDGDIEGGQGRGLTILDVGLLDRDAVDGQGSLPVGDHMVATDTDDPFDEVMAGVLRQKVH